MTANKESGAASPLDVRNVTTAEWDDVLPLCHVEELRLYHITLKSLDGMERLVETRNLTLEWATKIESLAPVFRMHGLTMLSIFDFPRLRSLSGIEALSNLTELSLSGSRASLNPPLRLTTIEPVKRIPNLISLSLTNARLADDDITPLAGCTRLRRLHLSMRFDRKQLAFLANRLNAQLETPIASHMESGLRCDQCDREKFMFAGHRMPILCRDCDRRRFDKLVDEFEAMVRDA
jgi:Leucine-rich repeat (LRR) protein